MIAQSVWSITYMLIQLKTLTKDTMLANGNDQYLEFSARKNV